MIARDNRLFGRPALLAFAALLAARASSVYSAAVTWVTNSNGDWSNPANWSSNPALPGPADDVTIDRGAANPEITLSSLSSGAQTINSLILNEHLLLIGGTLTAGNIQINNTLTLSSGTIANSNISFGPTGLLQLESSDQATLSNVAVMGDLLLNGLSDAYVTLAGNTSFTAARIQTPQSRLDMAPGYTLNSLVSGEGGGFVLLDYGGLGTVTFGPAAIVRLTSAAGSLRITDSSPSNLVNNGLITAEAAKGILTVQNSTFANNGIVQVLAGSLTIGSLKWSNSGTLTGTGGVLTLGGVFNATGGTGTFLTSAVTVNVTGTITNTGNTILLGADTGSWNLLGGTINNGSINETGGAMLIVTTSRGTLSNVTINGDLLLNVTSATVLLSGNTSFSAARLSANAVNLQMAPGYTLSSLVTDEGTTSGNRAITLAAGGAGTVTMTPAAIVRLAAGSGGSLAINNGSAATLINTGLITAEAAGQTLTIQPNVFINNGTVQASNGSALVISGQTTGTGNFIDGSASTFTTDGLIGNSFTVAGTAAIRSNGANTGTSKLNALSIANSAGTFTGKLDLSNNRLIVQSTDPDDKAAKLVQLTAAITSGSNGGLWTGKGLTSSTAAADPNHYGVGLFDNALLGLPAVGGQSVNQNSLLVSIAHLGDANDNGIVDIQDLSIVANNWQKPGTNWANGDLNGDGVVDIQDFTIVANNWQQTSSFSLDMSDSVLSPQSSSLSSVPEPATLPLFALAALFFRKRRAKIAH